MRRRTVLVLVAGRGAYRAANYGAGFALVGVWGAGTFARYAGAVGLAGWLFSLLAAGVERAALLQVAGSGGRRLESRFVVVGGLPFAAALVVWSALVAAVPGSTVATVAAAAALATGGGYATVLVALFRLRGRPVLDAATFMTLSLAYVVVVVLAAVGGIGPDALLGTLVGVVTVLDVALIAALRPGLERPVSIAWPELGETLRMAVTVSAGEVLALVAIAVLYAELAGEPARQTSVFYLANIVGAIIIGIWPYLLRLGQTRVTQWVSDDPDSARARLQRLTLLITGPGVALSVAGAVAVFVHGSGLTLAALALVAEMLMMVAVAFLAFVVEAIDRRTRDASALGALVGCLSIAAVGAVLVPAGGAAGALVSLCIGWTVRCPFLLRATRSRAEPVSAPAPAARR